MESSSHQIFVGLAMEKNHHFNDDFHMILLRQIVVIFPAWYSTICASGGFGDRFGSRGPGALAQGHHVCFVDHLTMDMEIPGMDIHFSSFLYTVDVKSL